MLVFSLSNGNPAEFPEIICGLILLALLAVREIAGATDNGIGMRLKRILTPSIVALLLAFALILVIRISTLW